MRPRVLDRLLKENCGPNWVYPPRQAAKPMWRYYAFLTVCQIFIRKFTKLTKKPSRGVCSASNSLESHCLQCVFESVLRRLGIFGFVCLVASPASYQNADFEQLLVANKPKNCSVSLCAFCAPARRSLTPPWRLIRVRTV